jgi:CheY-like chemotaxis protein
LQLVCWTVFSGKSMAQLVLVVEDNSINREVAVLQLRALGLDSVVADDGFAAIELVKRQRFSLILMDVMMPSMDGWEAARQIRELEQPQGLRTPIIGCSAWSASDNKDRCLQAGMDDYLSKPYDRNSLQEVLNRFLNVPQQ